MCVCVCACVRACVRACVPNEDIDLYNNKGMTYILNKIKSLLLSHHHSTCALVSEMLESVLQTVQKQFKYRQYILTDLYRRQCAEYTYIYSVHTVYY